MKLTLLLSFGLALALGDSAAAQAAPDTTAEMISNFRRGHGEGRVTLDATLGRIAQAQATAMAEQDLLDHDALAPFGSRVAAAGAERAAENIAYGYTSFAKTLGQWIDSPEHRKNLLLHDASKVGVAHAESAKTHRTYWAMVIAGGYQRRPPTVSDRIASTRAKPQPQPPSACHVKILGLCL